MVTLRRRVRAARRFVRDVFGFAVTQAVPSIRRSEDSIEDMDSRLRDLEVYAHLHAADHGVQLETAGDPIEGYARRAMDRISRRARGLSDEDREPGYQDGYTDGFEAALDEVKRTLAEDEDERVRGFDLDRLR